MSSEQAGGVPLPLSGWRHCGSGFATVPHVLPAAADLQDDVLGIVGGPVLGCAAWPLVHADVRFCVSVAKLDVSPNFESR